MRHSNFSRFISFVLILAITIGVPDFRVQAKDFPLTISLPSASQILGLTADYTPVMVRGMKVNSDNGLTFNFILDNGDTKLTGEALKAESEKIIKYFLVSLTTSEDDLWVNLSPFEKDRITSDKLYQTEMGRDLLGQDYILKKMTSSLLFPDTEAGKKFWEKIHKKIYEKFNDTNVPIDTFHKIWIIPESADLYVRDNVVMISNSKLKVMLEEDYFALEQSKRLRGENSEDTNRADSLFRDESVKKVLKEVIIPMIEQEVNSGEHFANLRQMYHAMILAKWFREQLREDLLNKIELATPKKEEPKQDQKQSQQQGEQKKDQQQPPPQDQKQQEQPPSIEEIYQKYLDAFQAGAKGHMREAYDPVNQDVVIRKYVTGGYRGDFSRAQLEQKDWAMLDFNFEGQGFNVSFGLQRVLKELTQKAFEVFNKTEIAWNTLLRFVQRNVGGIDFKTDEMKMNIQGPGVNPLTFNKNLTIKPEQIGVLIPTHISVEPLPNLNLLLGPKAATGKP